MNESPTILSKAILVTRTRW